MSENQKAMEERAREATQEMVEFMKEIPHAIGLPRTYVDNEKKKPYVTYVIGFAYREGQPKPLESLFAKAEDAVASFQRFLKSEAARGHMIVRLMPEIKFQNGKFCGYTRYYLEEK